MRQESVLIIIIIYRPPLVFPARQSGHLYRGSQVRSPTLIAAGPTLLRDDDQRQPPHLGPPPGRTGGSGPAQFAAREPHGGGR